MQNNLGRTLLNKTTNHSAITEARLSMPEKMTHVDFSFPYSTRRSELRVSMTFSPKTHILKYSYISKS